MKHGRWMLLAMLVMMHADVSRSGTFREDFDGPALDPAKWNFSPGEGGLTFVDGTAVLSSPGGRFPLLTPAGNPFPDGDWSLKVRFRFPSVAPCGNGLGSTREGADPMSESGFALWQDTGWGMRVAVGDTDPVNLAAAPDTSFHVYEWDRFGRTYLFYFDGALVASDESELRPTNFFFGHPQFVTCGTWTSEQIDFIQITSSGPQGSLPPRPAPKLPPNVVGLGWRSAVSAWPFAVLRDGTLLGGETGRVGNGKAIVGVVAVEPWGQGEQTVFACDDEGTIWAIGGSGARAGYTGPVGNVFDLTGAAREQIAVFGSDGHWMMAITNDGDMFAATAGDVVPAAPVIVQAVGNLFAPTPTQRDVFESLKARHR